MDERKVFTPLEAKIVSQRSGRVLRKSRKGRLAAESLGLTGVPQSSIGFSLYTCSAGGVRMWAEF